MPKRPADRTDQDTTRTPKRLRRRRTRRRLLIGAGVLLLLLVVLVALIPTIAGALIPSRLEAQLSDAINGRANVAAASFSWGSDQKIGPITITADDGQQVAVLSVSLDKGLLPLTAAALGLKELDLGRARLTGEAVIRRDAQGKTNVEKLAKPDPAKPQQQASQETKIPEGLSAAFILDGFDLTFIDEQKLRDNQPAAVVKIPDLTGQLAISDGKSAAASLAGTLQYAADLDAAPTAGGKVELVGTAVGLTDPNGVLQPTQMVLEMRLQAEDIALAIADTFADLETSLASAIGERLNVQLTAQGSLDNADASLAIASRSLNAQAALNIKDRILTLPRPAQITAQGPAIVALAPGLQQSLDQRQDVRFETLPDVEISLQELRFPIPASFQNLDLGNAAIRAEFHTTETRGTLTTGAQEGQVGTTQNFVIAPIDAALASSSLTESIALTATTSTTLDGRPAGEIDIDLLAKEPLTAAGGLQPDLPSRLEGHARIDSFTTAIADPFVEPLGLDLTRDVGPTLNLALEATPRPEPGAQPTAATPTAIALTIQSENIQADADFLFADNAFSTLEDGVQVTIQRLAPALNDFITESGITVESAGPITLTATDLSVILADLRTDAGTDFRALSGQIALKTGPASGSIYLPKREETQPWALSPVSATIDARQLAQKLRIQANTSATLGGEPAGTLTVDMTASNILTDAGAFDANPTLNGRATLQNIATRAAQPWAQGMGLDLPAGIGPQLTLSLIASSAQQPGAAAGRITNIDLALRSPGLTGDALMTYAERRIVSRGNGARFVFSQFGQLLNPAAANGGFAVTPGGALRIDAPQFAIPLASEQPLQDAAAQVQATISNLTIQPTAQDQTAVAEPAQPVTVQQIVASTTLAPDKPLRVQLRGNGSQANAPFSMQGDLALPGIFDPSTVRPLGTLELRNLPTGLAALIPGISGGGEGLNTLQLTREIVGPSLSLTFSATQPQGAAAIARDLSLNISSRGLNGRAGMQLTEDLFAVRELDMSANLPNSLVQQALAAATTNLASTPQIQGPGIIHLTASPFSIPLAAGARPDLQRAGNAEVRLALEGDVVVQNVQIAEEEGQPPRDIGPFTLRDIGLAAQVPISALVTGGGTHTAEANLTGSVLASEGEPFIDLGGGARLPLASARPAGPLQGELVLQVLDSADLDNLLNREGLIAGALGESARLTAGVQIRFEEVPANEDVAGAFPPIQQTLLTAAVEAPKVKTQRPLALEKNPERWTLAHPAVFSWLVEPAFANWYLLKAGEVDVEQAEIVRFVSPTEVTLTVNKLTLGAGEQGPLTPGVFDLNAQLNASAAELSVEQVPARFSGLQATITGGKEVGRVQFDFRIEDAGGASGERPAVAITGAVNSLANQQGELTPDLAMLSAQGRANGIPTAILDALARQGGLLREALGPTTNLTFEAQSLSQSGGNIRAELASERATGGLVGTIHEGTLILQQQAKAQLNVVTPELGTTLVKGLPLIGVFEKAPGQAPAIVTAENMTIPIDGDLSKLNGDIVFDPGEATFTTSNVFGKLLRVAGQRSAGIIGRRLDPFRAHVRNGIISYERFTLPLGEFTIDSEGTIDLVNRKLDVVTYVPFGALTDEAAGALNSGLGRAIGGVIPTIEKATMVPIRTTGSLDNPSTRPDPQLLAQNLGRTLLRPDKLIGGTLKDIFQKIEGPKREPDPAPPPAPQPPPP